MLEIGDDGDGFDATAAGGGFGLTGMRERAAAIGGVFTVTTAPGARHDDRVESRDDQRADRRRPRAVPRDGRRSRSKTRDSRCARRPRPPTRAVELAVEHKPDVALLDIRMPGDGIAAARRIAADAARYPRS